MAIRRGDKSRPRLEKRGLVPYFVHESSWRETARELDMIFWRVPPLPWEIEEAREKIFFLEKVMGKRTVPDFSRIMLFRNFPYQYMSLKARGFPLVPVIISHDYDEAMSKAEHATGPLLFRSEQEPQAAREELLFTGREMKKKISHAFRLGVPGRWPGHRDKQCVILMNAPEKEDLRGIFTCAGPYGSFGCGSSPGAGKKNLAGQLWDLASGVRAVGGFQDCVLEFRYNQKTGRLLLETVHPLIPGMTGPLSLGDCYLFDGGKESPVTVSGIPHVEKILMERLFQDE